MKTPDAAIREQLYANVQRQFEQAVRVVIEARRPVPAKLDTLNGLIKTAYQAGLDRGFDMAYTIYGEDA